MSAYDDAVIADGAAFYVTTPTGYAIAANPRTGGYGAVLPAGSYIDTGYSYVNATQLTFECYAASANGRVVPMSSRASTTTTGFVMGTNLGVSPPGNGLMTAAMNGYNYLSGRKSSAPNIADGQWHHLAATWKGDSTALPATLIAVYVDGVRVDNSTDGYAPAPISSNSSTKLYLGQDGTGANAGGLSISNCAVYFTALSAAQIAAHAAIPPLLSGVWGWVG